MLPTAWYVYDLSGQTVFVFLRLAYFTEHNILEVHPCCTMYQNFLPF